MKPYDDLTLPKGRIALDVTLPPYPLLEFALKHPASGSAMPYCMVSKEEEKLIRQDGFTPNTEVSADLLALLMAGKQKPFFSSKDKSLLFDLHEHKVYLMKTDKATAFIKKAREERRSVSPSVIVLLAGQHKVKTVGQRFFDDESEDKKVRMLLQEWYAIEVDRKESKNAILKDDTPAEAYSKLLASVNDNIQKMKIILCDMKESGTDRPVEIRFYNDLRDLKIEIALLEAYADVEFGSYQ